MAAKSINGTHRERAREYALQSKPQSLQHTLIGTKRTTRRRRNLCCTSHNGLHTTNNNTATTQTTTTIEREQSVVGKSKRVMLWWVMRSKRGMTDPKQQEQDEANRKFGQVFSLARFSFVTSCTLAPYCCNASLFVACLHCLPAPVVVITHARTHTHTHTTSWPNDMLLFPP
jgi:hypothetical protein